MSCGIYKITCVANNRFYIGKCTIFSSRKYQHLNNLRKNNHINKNIQIDFNIFGEDKFKFELIEQTHDLKNREQYYLNLYFDNQLLCYNIRYKNSTSNNPTETKKKRSISSAKMWENEEYRKRQSEIQSIKMKEYWASNKELKLKQLHEFHNSEKGKESHKLISDRMKKRKQTDITKEKLSNFHSKKYKVIFNDKIIEIFNLKKFSKDNFLSYDQMLKLVNNKIQQYKKYKLCLIIEK